jgi:hypothetical protein
MTKKNGNNDKTMNKMMKYNDKANDKIDTNIRSDTYFIKKDKEQYNNMTNM